MRPRQCRRYDHPRRIERQGQHRGEREEHDDRSEDRCHSERDREQKREADRYRERIAPREACKCSREPGSRELVGCEVHMNRARCKPEQPHGDDQERQRVPRQHAEESSVEHFERERRHRDHAEPKEKGKRPKCRCRHTSGVWCRNACIAPCEIG